MCCLFKARKINIKQKKPFFSLLFFLFSCVLLSAFPTWISLCTSPTVYEGYNQDVKNPLCKGRKRNFFSFKLLCLFSFSFFTLWSSYKARTKLETLSEYFDLQRDFSNFQCLFSSPFQSPRNFFYWIINNEGNYIHFNIFILFFSLFAFSIHNQNTTSWMVVRVTEILC